MSWMFKLYETFEAAKDSKIGKGLMPISHTPQNSHINIVIDGDGNFKSAKVEKVEINLPATEKSAGRSSGTAPHPLADKIQYVARDYLDFSDLKKESDHHEKYIELLRSWSCSDFSHPKIKAVYEYVKKGIIVSDLIDAKVLFIDENNLLRADWPFDDGDDPIPEIFKVLPKVNKKTDQGTALIRWTVEIEGDKEPNTWEDKNLQDKWGLLDAQEEENIGLCYILGEEKKISLNHPAKLRHTGDKAKLISANDMSGFTFRGRFTDTKKTIDEIGNQAAGVSFDVSQKAHNALRWLIDRQGYRVEDQYFVSWAVSGNKVPEPHDDLWGEIDESEFVLDSSDSSNNEEKEEHLDHSVDLGSRFAIQLNKYISGYRTQLNPTEQILVMGVDHATTGRMGVTYYREILSSDFLVRIEKWHNEFSWPQRYSREVGDGKKKHRKTFWLTAAPVPRNITDAAYGSVLKSSKVLKKNIFQRIIPCIIEGRPFPIDIMQSAVLRASNRNNCEYWEWERNLGVACALYKGFYLRHPDKLKRRRYDMALEENKTTRDYLYGRLLAVAEKLEEIALYVAGEKRPTAVARLMQRFADRPFSTWRNIELGLQPYMQRLQSSRAGFLVNRKKDLDTIQSLFENDDFTSDKALSGEFLLGFHCQRLALNKDKLQDLETIDEN
jgi:CRISPR-associated protein Csd1